MPAVLVHGVPDTHRLWDKLRSRLSRRDILTPSLPGFGVPLPPDFHPTKEAYVTWLIGEIERVGVPVDLVGHDWGGGFVVRLVSTEPDLVRTWVTDAAGIGDVSFEWHEFAKIWQTPGAGEEFFRQQLAQPAEARGGVFETFGVPAESARALGGWADETMAAAILDLYRSAVDVGKEWGPDFRDVPKPGLVVIPSDDPFLSAGGARSAAREAGAKTAELDGLGHWWMLQDPQRAARVLEDFWASTP